MSDDLRDLFQLSADEAPPLSPDVLSRAATRGRTLHRRRVSGICVASAAVVALAVAAPLALRGQDRTAEAPVASQPPSTPSPVVPSTTAAPDNEPGVDPKVRIYVVLRGSGLPYVGIAPHRVPAPDLGQPDALRAVQALLDLRHVLPWGFAGAENGWASPFDGVATRALAVRHEAGTITVELTGAGPRTCTHDYCAPAELVVQQMVLTVQHAYRSDDPVVITVDGQRLNRR